MPTPTLGGLSVLCSPSTHILSHSHSYTLLKRNSRAWPTCGVSFPTLWVIGSFITTSTLQASFSLGMSNFRSSPDRKAELPFTTLTPRFTLMKVGLAQPRSSSSRAVSPPQLTELMPTGPARFRPPVKSLQQRRASVLLPGMSAHSPRGSARGTNNVPDFLTCFFHCKLRQGGLSGNPNAFNITRWSLLTTLARLMCFSNPANGNRGWRKVRKRPKGLYGYSKDPYQQSNLSTSLSF